MGMLDTMFQADSSGSDSKAANDKTLAPLAMDKELLQSLDTLSEYVAQSERGKRSDAAQQGFKALKTSIQMAAIAKRGFGAQQHVYEQEGSDALLFRHVPWWIKYQKISGYRYRQVGLLADLGDEIDHAKDGVTFFGYPGASGWADKIGDVAVHYLHAEWAVFSKVFPFHEQGVAREQHEDLLLLASSKHVMLTPGCARAIGSAGLHAEDTGVTLLDSEGSAVGEKRVLTKSLSAAVRHRLYLTWGHDDSPFAVEVGHFARPLQALIDEPEKLGHRARRLLNSVIGGRIKVAEEWKRYPGAPLDPLYYSQLLAEATSMSDAEERTRELLHPLPSPRATVPTVTIDVSAGEGAKEVCA